MKKQRLSSGALFAALYLVGAACSQTGVGAADVTPASIKARTRFDCLASNCPPIVIQGDGPAKLPNGTVSPFSGMADPSLRKDPDSNRIWLAYSWPNIHLMSPGSHVTSVDAHLAYSDDGGNIWKYDKALWPSIRTANKAGSNESGYMSEETPNLLPVRKGNGLTWFGVRLAYFVPDAGIKRRPVTSFQLNIMQASSPEALASAPYQTLGSSVTSTWLGRRRKPFQAISGYQEM